MNVLLTGGTGLIGRHLIPRLLELGHRVTVSTRSPEKGEKPPRFSRHSVARF